MVVAAGTLAASRVFARAAVRYRLLVVAFGLVAAIGPLALAAAVLRPMSGPIGGGFAPGTMAVRLDAIALPVFTLAAAVAAALLLQLAFDVVRLRRIKRGAWPIGTVPIRAARIGMSEVVTTPTAIGYLHPAVVVPADFRARVDDGEWSAVIAHECAHLARRDDWAKALQSAVLRACWWLPGLWLLARALDLEREVASDERAAGEAGPRRYAACLLRLATDRGVDALAPGLWGRRSQVAIRVERLLRPSAHATPVVRATALGALTAATLAALAFAAMAVPPTGRLTAIRPPAHLIRIAGASARAGAPARSAVRLALRPVHRRPARGVAASARRSTATVSAEATAVATAPALPASSAARTVRRLDVQGVTEIAASAVPVPVNARRAAPLAAQTARSPVPAVKAGLAAGGPSAEGSLGAPEFLAFARPHSQCPTCFGPLRSPDTASPGAPIAPPARFDASPAAIAAIASDDPTGATDLRSRVYLIRIPRVSAP